MNHLLDISPVTSSLLTLLFPLLACVYQAILGKKDQSGIASLIAIISSTLFSGVFVFAEIWNNTPIHTTWSWFTVGNKSFTIGILLNNSTVLMQFLVCIIALPVHIYSRSYMKGDTGIHRYWMYLSLFCFSMLGLTISKNLLMMYVFWELVGFASYLLIGFWFTKDTAVQANKKAFIINRIGDLGFLIGIGLVYSHVGTLDLVELFGKDSLDFSITSKDATWLTFAGIGFFVGAMAKSAQFPLHVWLPDAMEGPTSVSSLIHAATMVAAGVFLLATLFPLFNEIVLLFIVIIGTITATIAAYFALTQNDIKKVLAFSTISQLGFMIVGIGIGAWYMAIFHLVTHAFFKCLLFLCAGAVIHEMNHAKEHQKLAIDPQDIRNMGGLKKSMPYTFVLMLTASLALSGFPLTAGFLSKDSIIITAFEWANYYGNWYILIPSMLVLVSTLTAFYIGRVIFKTFLGVPKIFNETHIHEAPKNMLIPMFFLSVCSLFFVFSTNPFSYENVWLIKGLFNAKMFPVLSSLHVYIPIGMTLAMTAAWFIAWRWYVKETYPFTANSLVMRLSREQGYLNQFYTILFVNNTLKLSNALYWFDRNIVDGIVNGAAFSARRTAFLSAWIDKYLVDGLVNVVAQTTYYIGHLLRWIQNGRLQSYMGFAFTMVLLGILYLVFK